MRTGRWTLGLYNSYDPNHFHETMRRALARAAPLCHSFDMNLAAIGFPFHAFRDKDGAAPDRLTPDVLAGLVADSTSIGDGGSYLRTLASDGRFLLGEFSGKGFPPQWGQPVLATRKPDAKKLISVRELAYRTHVGQSFLLLVGLGPRGVPKEVHQASGLHLELSDGNHSLETATAMGVLAGRLYEARRALTHPRGPAVAVDAVVLRDEKVLLIRRGGEPFQGRWALPGGFLEPAESAEDGVLRELREETGLEGSQPHLLGVFSKPGRDPRGPVVALVYTVHASAGPPRGGDDASDARFFPVDALPPMAFDHDRIVREAVARARKPQS